MVKGRSKPEIEKSKPIKTYIKKELLLKLDELKNQKNITRSKLIEQIILEYFENQK